VNFVNVAIDIFLIFYDGKQGQKLGHSNFFFYFEHEGCQTGMSGK
jgi:hypothetical protein